LHGQNHREGSSQQKNAKTEITPTCPSSLRSKITTETTFDAGAKSRIEALSSRITPMKMNDHAAISPSAPAARSRL